MIITEDFIQQQIVIWYNNNYCLNHHNPQHIIFAVPNGGKRDAREAKKLSNTGLLKGASDLIIVNEVSNIYVEVKTEIGVQSTDQKVFQDKVEKLGYIYIMPRSLDQFKYMLVNRCGYEEKK